MGRRVYPPKLWCSRAKEGVVGTPSAADWQLGTGQLPKTGGGADQLLVNQLEDVAVNNFERCAPPIKNEKGQSAPKHRRANENASAHYGVVIALDNRSLARLTL